MKNYLAVGLVVVLVIIITFIILIFMPSPKCFFIQDKTYPQLNTLIDPLNFNNILEECKKIDYKGASLYKLYHKNVVHDNMLKLPALFNLIKDIPEIHNVFIKRIAKKIKTPVKRGSANLSNKTLRCALPLVISGAKKSGIWVDGETRFYMDQEWVVYDNSKESYVFNEHKRKETVLLVIDITRSDALTPGTAIETHDDLF